MVEDLETVAKIKRCILDMERETGLVPSIESISGRTGIRPGRIRSVIRRSLQEEDTDGTSSFKESLRNLLLGTRRDGSNRREHFIQVRDEHGESLGTLLLREAQILAQERDLILVLSDIKQEPPLAVLMEFGKFKFQNRKRSRLTEQQHHVSSVKEIRLRCEIASNDYEIKLNYARRMLASGRNVKIFSILSDRELKHKELAKKTIEKFAGELSEISVVEQELTDEGSEISLVVAPS